MVVVTQVWLMHHVREEAIEDEQNVRSIAKNVPRVELRWVGWSALE